MTDKEAYNLIGERAADLVKNPEVRQLIMQEPDKDAAIKKLYMLAIATLCGREAK